MDSLSPQAERAYSLSYSFTMAYSSLNVILCHRMSLSIIKIGASSFTDFSQANGTDPLGFHGIPPRVPHRGRLDANDSVGTDEHQVSVQCGVLARLEGVERLFSPSEAALTDGVSESSSATSVLSAGRRCRQHRQTVGSPARSRTSLRRYGSLVPFVRSTLNPGSSSSGASLSTWR
jgi:hypothetical protein